jgi:hypothetical protein
VPYCTNCGEEVADDQRYCSYCGESVGDAARREHDDHGQRDQPGRHERGPRDHQSPDRTGDVGGFEGDPPPEGYEDPPGVGAGRSTRSPGPGTVELFTSSMRAIFGYPLLLGGLFVAWLGFFLLYFFAPPGLSPAVLLTGLFGLFVAGMIHVGTEQDRDGEPTSVGTQARRVLGSFVPLVGIWLLFVIPFGIGLTFLLLPGLFIGSRLFLAFPACVLDGEGVFDSLSTSWNLTSGISLKTFGLLFLALLSVVALVIVLSVFTTGILLAAGADLPTEAGSSPTEAAEQLELTDYPTLIVAASVSYAISLAIAVGAVQVAAARLYLTLRYSTPGSEPR